MENNSVSISLISPSGVAMALSVPQKTGEDLMDFLERADAGAKIIAKRDGWDLASATPSGPSVAELQSVPTFCGYQCSDMRDDNGFPTFIIANGKQAMRREKQGDTWYSYRDDGGDYVQVIRIPKGEKVS